MKLSKIFSKERGEIEKEISKATSLNRVTEVVQDRLGDLEKIYIGGKLTVAQVRLASSFLETLRQSIAVTTTSERVLDPKPQSVVDRVIYSPNSLILKVLQALICLGILSSLVPLTQTAPGAWMTILLTSLLVGIEVVIQRDKDKPDSTPLVDEAPQTTAVPVDSKVLLDNIAEALDTIDLAVASAGEGKKPLDASGIEELPELLNFLQRLMGASVLEKPQMMIQLSKLLPQILLEQGIRSQIYQPNAGQSDREYFDFEPSIDRSAKEYLTITPALLKGDRLIRKGRVIEPAHEAKE